MASLLPGEWLLQSAVDLLFHCAVQKLKRRGSIAVRVVPSAAFSWWLGWAGREPTPDVEVPGRLRDTDFRGVDCVLIPWHQQSHYSTIIISNIRTPSSVPCLPDHHNVPDSVGVCKRLCCRNHPMVMQGP